MVAIKEIEKINKINKDEFDSISRMLLESFLIKSHHNRPSSIGKQGELLDYFSAFLEKYLELHFLNSAQDKLEIINFIDKLHLQRELIEIQNGETKFSDIKLAGERLGRKSQSAFLKK